jgi:hypothetical protein
MDDDLDGRALFPLHELVAYDKFALAAFLPPESARAVFDRLVYTESWNSWDGYDERITAIVVPYEELALEVPGWDGVRFVVRAPSMPTPIFAEFVVGPGSHTKLENVTTHVRFDPHLLRDAATGDPAHFDVQTDIEAYPEKGLAIGGPCLRAHGAEPVSRALRTSPTLG